MPITSLASLERHLQWAIQLELTTIPPYLCALYSIKDGHNLPAQALIRGVVMEEMLHVTLAANLLNAIGGTPRLAHADVVPRYPGKLPHSNGKLTVKLLPFSPAAIAAFRAIEHPAPAGARPEGHAYHTIGQFYEAIADGFGDRARQVAPSHYYGAGGEPTEVTDLASALRAIAEICEQGEGYDGTIHDDDTQFGQPEELAHYYRFTEIALGRCYLPSDTPRSGPTGPEFLVDWDAVYPMRPDPKMRQWRARPDVHALMLACNRRYSDLLYTLEEAFTGRPAALQAAVPVMYDLKYRAQALMAIPTGDADGRTVGPSFEFVPRAGAARATRGAAAARRPGRSGGRS
jgi:hypothetical protein